MNVTTVKVAVDPISYAVRESISGRFGDWPIESIQGWMLGRGVPAEECDRVGTYIDADRMTVLLGRWWHNGHRWWIDELKIMQSEIWKRRAK